MTAETKTSTYHVIRAGLTLPVLSTSNRRVPDGALAPIRSVVAPVGFELEISPALIESTRDRWGDSLYEDLSDELQIRRWGAIYLQPGHVTEALSQQLSDEWAAEAEKRRLEQRREAAKYGKSTPLSEAEILAAADRIRANLERGR